MLVLTRKKHERIIITIAGQRLTVEVSEIHGSQVRLAFEAPPQFKVLRGELVPHEVGGKT